ncbi:hypothetical protein D3C80_1605990 [compost metagenome]
MVSERSIPPTVLADITPAFRPSVLPMNGAKASFAAIILSKAVRGKVGSTPAIFASSSFEYLISPTGKGCIVCRYVAGAMPARSSVNAAQFSATLSPIALIMPIPVIYAGVLLFMIFRYERLQWPQK